MTPAVRVLIYLGAAALGALLGVCDGHGQPTPTPLPKFQREPYSNNTYPQPRPWLNQPAADHGPLLVPYRCVQEYGRPIYCEWRARQ